MLILPNIFFSRERLLLQVLRKASIYCGQMLLIITGVPRRFDYRKFGWIEPGKAGRAGKRCPRGIATVGKTPGITLMFVSHVFILIVLTDLWLIGLCDIGSGYIWGSDSAPPLAPAARRAASQSS